MVVVVSVTLDEEFKLCLTISVEVSESCWLISREKEDSSWRTLLKYELAYLKIERAWVCIPTDLISLATVVRRETMLSAKDS
jgi:hypothetical protein